MTVGDQFVKLLHIKAEQEAFPILARLAQVPEYVQAQLHVQAQAKKRVLALV